MYLLIFSPNWLRAFVLAYIADVLTYPDMLSPMQAIRPHNIVVFFPHSIGGVCKLSSTRTNSWAAEL